MVSALGCEVDRLEEEIQRLVPGIRHVDIETHNPNAISNDHDVNLEVTNQNKRPNKEVT